MLEAKDIGFRYERGSWIFRHVHLCLNDGEVVGLYGPSGQGKTTLAKILAGYEDPIEGQVMLAGNSLPLSGGPPHPVQLVWQHPEKSVNPKWRLADVLKEAGQTDQELLATLGVQPTWLSRWPHEISGGELQRVCLARALAPYTRYLIADEMTTMLDAVTQAQIWHVVLDIVKKRQIGVLAVSHDKKLLKRISTRIIDFSSL